VRVWLDAQVAPAVAAWMRDRFGVDAVAIRDLGLLRASDRQIFDAARLADAVVLTKDGDFVELLERDGPPPRVVWLRCGNTSNARLRELLEKWWPTARAHLDAGERLVEIADGAVGGPVT
jgi:predicted nuclease of predicted toxin-antitoxin system